MGHGIALVAAKSGYDVVIKDIKEKTARKGIKRIEKFLTVSVEKGRMTEEIKKETLSRIKSVSELKDIKNCDLVIEAIAEDLESKKRLFKELDDICSANTIFASNTSTISITKLSTATKRPDRFIGMHFMNPVAIITLVEVIRGSRTSKETTETIKAMVKKIGKIPIEINDSPGFVSNRLLLPMINEAVYCLRENIATKEAIDDVMKVGMGHPMGPLELADLIGLDICLNIMKELYQGFSDSKYKPCPLLEEMVNSGRLGRKTGKGFYNYDTNNA